MSFILQDMQKSSLILFFYIPHSYLFLFLSLCPSIQTLMKELDEMEKVNAKLSTAVEDVTLEHCKKNEVSLEMMTLYSLSFFCELLLFLIQYLFRYFHPISKLFQYDMNFSSYRCWKLIPGIIFVLAPELCFHSNLNAFDLLVKCRLLNIIPKKWHFRGEYLLIFSATQNVWGTK